MIHMLASGSELTNVRVTVDELLLLHAALPTLCPITPFPSQSATLRVIPNRAIRCVQCFQVSHTFWAEICHLRCLLLPSLLSLGLEPSLLLSSASHCKPTNLHLHTIWPKTMVSLTGHRVEKDMLPALAALGTGWNCSK